MRSVDLPPLILNNSTILGELLALRSGHIIPEEEALRSTGKEAASAPRVGLDVMVKRKYLSHQESNPSRSTDLS
jgi:hypothetical protein